MTSPGLRERSVGLRGDWIASITNVAPTAATTLTMAALIGASGLASPLALLIAGAAMLCCAVAYHRLNSWQSSASAPVEWVARGLSPIIGFAVGILVLMTALTSNIGNSVTPGLPSGQAGAGAVFLNGNIAATATTTALLKQGAGAIILSGSNGILSGPILINAGRGGLQVEGDLVAALDSGGTA